MYLKKKIKTWQATKKFNTSYYLCFKLNNIAYDDDDEKKKL